MMRKYIYVSVLLASLYVSCISSSDAHGVYQAPASTPFFSGSIRFGESSDSGSDAGSINFDFPADEYVQPAMQLNVRVLPLTASNLALHNLGNNRFLPNSIRFDGRSKSSDSTHLDNIFSDVDTKRIVSNPIKNQYGRSFLQPSLRIPFAQNFSPTLLNPSLSDKVNNLVTESAVDVHPAYQAQPSSSGSSTGKKSASSPAKNVTKLSVQNKPVINYHE